MNKVLHFQVEKIVFALANVVATASKKSFRCNDEIADNILTSLNS